MALRQKGPVKKIMQQLQTPFINVLTNVTSDVVQPSLMLQTKDGNKYILGRLGEGFQRSLGQNKIRSTKLQGIFLTGDLRWSSIAGLPGYSLSLHGVFKQPLKIYTALPEKFKSIYGSFKRFITHTPIDVGTVSSELYSDANVEIEPVLVGNATSLIVQLMPVRGKFDVKRARELGVPPGPLFGQLTAGKTVTLENGTTVSPDEVVGPSPTPSRILVLDLPTQEHIGMALTKPWTSRGKRKRDSIEYEVAVSAVYYFLGRDVDPGCPDLSELAASFGSSTKHIVSHPLYTPDMPILTSFVDFETALKKEFPQNFSSLYSNSSAKELELSNSQCLKIGHVLSCPTADAVKEKAPADLAVADNGGLMPGTLSEPEVVTLGTGGGMPSKFRNVSGTLVRVPQDQTVRSVLFDCGEGTIRTMMRLYGPEECSKRLQELDTLYVSHMHADHHLGCLELIRAWMECNPTKQLTVLGPGQLLNFFNDWRAIDATEILLDRIRFVDHAETCIGKGYVLPTGPRPQFDGYRVQTCRAIHCPFSYNGAITFDNGFKVSFSGDTRPNRFFAQTIGKDSTLLIHEATHEDELCKEAYEKFHSTVSEAVGVADQMGARHTILTHLSQRYPRLPVSEGISSKSGPICFAFDTMHVSLSGIAQLQNAVPRLSEIMMEVASEDEDDNDNHNDNEH